MIEEFKTQLITALLSSPVVYIPHFHYAFVDGILESIVNPPQGQRQVVALDAEDIVEFDIARGIIDFTAKQRRKNLDTLSKLDVFLETLIEKKTFTNEKVFVFKNMGDVWSDPHIQTYIQMFASMYECDMRNPDDSNNFHPLTTLIIVSPETVSMLPAQLEKIVTVIDVPAPTQEEIMTEVESIPVSYEYATESQIAGIRTEMCRTLQGLQLYEVNQILKSASVRTGGFLSQTTIKLALEETLPHETISPKLLIACLKGNICLESSQIECSIRPDLCLADVSVIIIAIFVTLLEYLCLITICKIVV